MDVFEFVRLRRHAQGEVGLGRFVRLLQDLPEQPQGEAGLVRWAIDGEQGTRGEQLLRLQIQARPLVQCQRCLQPFAWPVQAEVLLQPVLTEAELDEGLPLDEEEDLDASQPEKVLGSRRFDLLAQIEDELILSIPYVPRHEVCPDGSPGAGGAQAQDERRPSPFEALARLKRNDADKA
ncbi:DUF177 domain-containing protein [Orrella sp. JC864]|uniref:YceD family protein n=1 Tax=Orrella sp. JC864 TaxID=3120298 RepID=UPI0012BB5CAF